jgi:hypothetical protein
MMWQVICDWSLEFGRLDSLKENCDLQGLGLGKSRITLLSKDYLKHLHICLMS